jgi:hypothetical protein
MTRDLSIDRLVEFAASMLSDLPPHLREREHLEGTVEQHQELWATLYEATGGVARAGGAVQPSVESA